MPDGNSSQTVDIFLRRYAWDLQGFILLNGAINYEAVNGKCGVEKKLLVVRCWLLV